MAGNGWKLLEMALMTKWLKMDVNCYDNDDENDMNDGEESNGMALSQFELWLVFILTLGCNL